MNKQQKLEQEKLIAKLVGKLEYCRQYILDVRIFLPKTKRNKFISEFLCELSDDIYDFLEKNIYGKEEGIYKETYKLERNRKPKKTTFQLPYSPESRNQVIVLHSSPKLVKIKRLDNHRHWIKKGNYIKANSKKFVRRGEEYVFYCKQCENDKNNK